MIRNILFIVGLFFSMQLFAQTGIGTTTPDASAKLDVSATNKGFLPPRVTLSGISDNSTIPSPATGLLIYNTGNNVGLAAGYYYWNGNAWATIATSGGSGSFAASFLRGSRTATQSIAVDGIVSFSTVNNTAGQDIALNTGNGKITLAPGNTYRIIASVPNFSGGQRPAFMWYNETTSSFIGSASSTYNPGDAASLAASGGIAHVIITPSVSTVLSFRLLSSLSANVTVGGNGDFSTTGSYPWFEAQVISGNAPVTGQSVDYGIARYTGADAGGLAAGALVSFDATAAGNLSWSANKFTLKANKTYEIESSLAIYNTSSGSAGRFQIYDYTNAISLANSLFMSQNGTGSNSQNANTPMKCIVTPATDIQVGIRLLDFYGGAPGIVGNAVLSGSTSASNTSYFVVKQIGSSAIINPWTLSGTNTYNTTGNVGIGTSSPTTTLDVTGSLQVSGNTTLKSNLNIGTGVGSEGGEIQLANAASGSSLSGTAVSVDIYQDRLRIFEGGGNFRGVFLDLAKAPSGVGGELMYKASGFVNRGVDVTLGNLKARIAATGNFSVQLSTVSGSYSVYGSHYLVSNGSFSNGIAGSSPRSISTTPTYINSDNNFIDAGNTSVWLLMDTTAQISWRITMIVGAGFNNNFISIERL